MRSNNRNVSTDVVPGTGKFLEQQSKDNDDVDINITDEFDFESNLKRFDMSKLKEAIPDKWQEEDTQDNEEETANGSDKESTDDEKAKKSEATVTETVRAYTKDDFFDSLSTDRDDRRGPSGSQLRELNAETFGKIGSTYRCRDRWFRRRRGNYADRGVFRGGFNQGKQ